MKNLIWIILMQYLYLQVSGTNINQSHLYITEAPQILAQQLTNTTNFVLVNTTHFPEINNTFSELSNATETSIIDSEYVTRTLTINALDETLNYTVLAEAIKSVEKLKNYRLEKTAAIAAGVFLVSAIIGYTSCVGYRRYLQRKYGDKQKLGPEDVYDTSDLRYFEI